MAVEDDIQYKHITLSKTKTCLQGGGDKCKLKHFSIIPVKRPFEKELASGTCKLLSWARFIGFHGSIDNTLKPLCPLFQGGLVLERGFEVILQPRH